MPLRDLKRLGRKGARMGATGHVQSVQNVHTFLYEALEQCFLDGLVLVYLHNVYIIDAVCLDCFSSYTFTEIELKMMQYKGVI